jgi:hypothetical protein
MSFDYSRVATALAYHHPDYGCGYNACEVCLMRESGQTELALHHYLVNGYAGDSGLPCGCVDAEELARNDGHDTLVDDFGAVFRPAEESAATARYAAWLAKPGNADICRSCDTVIAGRSGSCGNCGSADTVPFAKVRR